MVKQTAKRFLLSLGYQVSRTPLPSVSQPSWEQEAYSPDEKETINLVRPFTLTSPERIYAAVSATKYIAQKNIPGALVECGVWRGGSAIAMARTLLNSKHPLRDLFLYDTFEGMPPAREEDRTIDGRLAEGLIQQSKNAGDTSGAWCYASLDEVKRNMATTDYPENKIHFVKGRVEQTIPAVAPETIALLRLDTDLYESTRHQLEHLYPRLSPGGVLIIDDYGFWQGCRKAVDEYFQALGITLLLNRIDQTGRIGIKV